MPTRSLSSSICWVAKKGSDSPRNAKMCGRADVLEACPSACGVCCGDDAEFTFKGNFGKNQTCEWIGKQFDKRKNQCEKIR